MSSVFLSSFFFFNDTATTEIYTLSLHDALPISGSLDPQWTWYFNSPSTWLATALVLNPAAAPPSPVANFTSSCSGLTCRSEEHTSELQSPCNLVCRLLLEKKKKKNKSTTVSDQH